MSNKERFLKENIGFHYDDLSLIRQMELDSLIQKLGLSNEWVYLALSKDKLEGWEKWGFALFSKPEFRQDVDRLLAAFDKLDDEKFKKELKKKNKGEKSISVNKYDFDRVYEAIKQQGKVLTQAEAEEEGLTTYWTYSYTLTPVGRENADIYAARAASGDVIDDDEWVSFILSFQKIRGVNVEV